MSISDCPVCSKPMIKIDHEIWRCCACNYYKSSFAAGAGTGIGGLEALRRRNFEMILDRLATHRNLADANLLEVGCAKGWFLDAARKRRIRAIGIEPELANQRVAAGKGLDVIHGYFPLALPAGSTFDFVVFNDVFEHLPDPAAAIRAVADCLSPTGLAVINIPSSGGVLFSIAKVLRRIGIVAPWHRLWQRGMASPHISYFNADNLVLLAQANTTLRPLDRSRLETLSRDGLAERVLGANPGLAGRIMFGATWLMSFVGGVLPPDIILVILEKPDPTNAAS